MKTAAALVAVLLLGASLASAEQRPRVRPRSMTPRPSRPSTPAPPPSNIVPGLIVPQTPLIPAPTPANAPPTPFDARRGTYAPHYNDPNARPRYGYGVPFYAGAVGVSDDAPAETRTAAPDQPPPAAASAPPAPAPVPEAPRVASLHPDTFYVIEGCYAGNRPPNPARLPKGCDLAKLREIPVR
ncbi:MAG TPA: hypothetical protein VN628_07390 [Vicinamibacterales bacterium]|nr:hypothetical protein [Vicinamibacterales bacterium]